MGYDRSEARWKYTSKLDHVRLRMFLKNKIIDAHENFESKSAIPEYVQAVVKSILDKHGVLPEAYVYYIAYAEALYRSQLTLEWLVDLKREHAILRNRFERRGLDKYILDEIDRMLIIRYNAKK